MMAAKAGKAAMDGMIEVGVYDGQGDRTGTRVLPATAIDLSPREVVQTAIVPEPGGRAWFVLRTQPQAEKDAEAALNDAGYDTFRPVMRKDVVARHSKKLTTREFTLFAGYLFAELPRSTRAWAAVHAIEEITGALGTNATPTPIEEGAPEVRGTLRYFMARQADGAFDETRAAKIARGEIVDTDSIAALRAMFTRRARVRVADGWLAGFHGHVVNVTGRATVKAMIETLSGMMLVELNAKALELAE